jgi:hypothetical protein
VIYMPTAQMVFGSTPSEKPLLSGGPQLGFEKVPNSLCQP